MLQRNIKNEDLKREIKDKITENVTVEVAPTSKEDIAEIIKNMSDEDKKEIEKLLKTKEDKKEE